MRTLITMDDDGQCVLWVQVGEYLRPLGKYPDLGAARQAETKLHQAAEMDAAGGIDGIRSDTNSA